MRTRVVARADGPKAQDGKHRWSFELDGTRGSRLAPNPCRATTYNVQRMSLLTLVRHGQASFGTHDYDRLSAVGERQAGLLGEHLAAIDRLPHALYSGTLKRQQHTARIIAATTALDIAENPAFDEYDAAGLLKLHSARHGTSIIELQHEDGSIDPRRFQRRLEKVGLAWVSGELADPSLETWHEFRSRVAAGIDHVLSSAARSERVMVCTSAGVVAAAVGHLLALDDQSTLRLSWSVHNSSITQVLFDGARRSLLSFNAVPHLESPARRELITFR